MQYVIALAAAALLALVVSPAEPISFYLNAVLFGISFVVLAKLPDLFRR